MDWNGVLVSSGHMAPLHLGHCRLAETQPSLHSCLALRLQTALRDRSVTALHSGSHSAALVTALSCPTRDCF